MGYFAHGPPFFAWVVDETKEERTMIAYFDVIIFCHDGLSYKKISQTLETSPALSMGVIDELLNRPCWDPYNASVAGAHYLTHYYESRIKRYRNGILVLMFYVIKIIPWEVTLNSKIPFAFAATLILP